MIRETKTIGLDLLQYTLMVFSLGMIVGVLLHYVDFGWPPKATIGIRLLIFASAGILTTCVLAGFRGLVKSLRG